MSKHWDPGRKPVASGHANYEGTLVICDDGAVFALAESEQRPAKWFEIAPIPGTARAATFAEYDANGDERKFDPDYEGASS